MQVSRAALGIGGRGGHGPRYTNVFRARPRSYLVSYAVEYMRSFLRSCLRNCMLRNRTDTAVAQYFGSISCIAPIQNGLTPHRVRPVDFARRQTSLWPFARTARGVFVCLCAALRPSTDQREALPGLNVLQAAGGRADAVALRP